MKRIFCAYEQKTVIFFLLLLLWRNFFFSSSYFIRLHINQPKLSWNSSCSTLFFLFLMLFTILEPFHTFCNKQTAHDFFFFFFVLSFISTTLYVLTYAYEFVVHALVFFHVQQFMKMRYLKGKTRCVALVDTCIEQTEEPSKKNDE